MRVPKDDSERKAIDDIRRCGLHVINVLEDDHGPGFSYSIGLFENYVHPEIIIIGLKHELAHTLLNDMAWEIKQGKTYTSGEYHSDVLDGFLCYFGDVPRSHYKNYVGWNIWFYRGYDFPLVQCVYPTVSGKFVWDADFPEDARWYCQMLTEPPKEH